MRVHAPNQSLPSHLPPQTLTDYLLSLDLTHLTPYVFDLLLPSPSQPTFLLTPWT